MATFAFSVNAETQPNIITAALGVNAAGTYTGTDVGKAVKHTANVGNMAPCGDGDSIDGFVHSVYVDQPKVNTGFNVGGVQTTGRKIVQVAAGSATCARGDLVVAAAQAAVGTASLALVKKFVYNPADLAASITALNANVIGKRQWRILEILTSNGAAGSQILVERV